MSRLRSALLGGIAWVVVVAACATGVWLVIDRVGRDVLSATPLAQEAPTARPGTAYPTEEPLSGTTTTPPATSQPPAGLPVPASSTRTGTHQSSPAVTAPPPPTQPLPSPPATTDSPVSRSGAVAVAGGRVGVACTGDRISLKFVTPESGWSFSVETESDHIGVHFVATNGNGDTEVSARCANGAPVFDTAAGGDQ